MLKGMTVAEASAQSEYIMEQELDDKLWEQWLTGGHEGQSFDEFKSAQRAAARGTTARTSTARPLRPGEEDANLAFAAQFVKNID